MPGADKSSFAGSIAGANMANIRVCVVTDNVDPGGDYRVKVKFTTLPEADDSEQEEESFFCRIATFGAGKGGRGMFALPEKDDEVIVGFLDGSIDHAVILGTLWNGK